MTMEGNNNQAGETKIVINATREVYKKFQQIKNQLNEKAIEYGYGLTNRATFTRMVRIISEIKDLVEELKQMQLSSDECLGQLDEFFNIIRRYEEKWGIRLW